MNGENGLKVRLESPEHYAAEFGDKLMALTKNPELRTRLGEAARRYVLENHDWHRIGEQALGVYEELR